MIPDFPHNIRIRLAQLILFCIVLMLLCLCPVGCLSLAETANRAETEQHQDATKKSLIGPILFLHYEESLASSNLNFKLLRVNCAHPNAYATAFQCSSRLTKAIEGLGTL